MTLFEELERLKLQFIAACETLVKLGKITEGNFGEILQLLDSMDEHDQAYIDEKLYQLTDGQLDLMFWEKDDARGFQ